MMQITVFLIGFPRNSVSLGIPGWLGTHSIAQDRLSLLSSSLCPLSAGILGVSHSACRQVI